MSAKNSDDARVLELYRVIQETKTRIEALGVTKKTFLADDSALNRAAADSLLMCVFRATEEAGSMSSETRRAHPDIEWRCISGMRNILAHDYGNVDREIIWASIEHDFPELGAFCKDYATAHGLNLA